MAKRLSSGSDNVSEGNAKGENEEMEDDDIRKVPPPRNKEGFKNIRGGWIYNSKTFVFPPPSSDPSVYAYAAPPRRFFSTKNPPHKRGLEYIPSTMMIDRHNPRPDAPHIKLVPGGSDAIEKMRQIVKEAEEENGGPLSSPEDDDKPLIWWPQPGKRAPQAHYQYLAMGGTAAVPYERDLKTPWRGGQKDVDSATEGSEGNGEEDEDTTDGGKHDEVKESGDGGKGQGKGHDSETKSDSDGEEGDGGIVGKDHDSDESSGDWSDDMQDEDEDSSSASSDDAEPCAPGDTHHETRYQYVSISMTDGPLFANTELIILLSFIVVHYTLCITAM